MENQLQKTGNGITPESTSLSAVTTNNAKAILASVVRSNVSVEVFTADHENHPTVSKLARNFGKPLILEYIVLCIEHCLAGIQVKEPTELQILEIANELLIDEPTWKLEDFQCFFKKIKKGEFGKDYNRFDLSTVYQFRDLYNQERNYIFEKAMEQRNKKPVLEGVDMDALYAKFREEGSQRARVVKMKKLPETRVEAKKQWEKERDSYFQGKNPTEIEFFDYAYKYPFNQSYIDWWVRNNLKG